MNREFGIKVVKLMAWVALGFAVGCHLWAANRGLEMTDEASYLLIALDPWHTWGHGTFHGFLLRPLYLLGGSSVVGMRWIGYALLLVSAWRLASAVRQCLGTREGIIPALTVPVLLTAAMTVYCGGIRTPCYNWMILVGAILAWSGWLRCGSGRFGSIEMGLGLTMALAGKWGAALILLGLLAGLSLAHRKASFGPKIGDWRVALFSFGITTLLFAMYAGWDGIKDTLRAGVLIAQTTGSHGWFIVPKYGEEILYYGYRVARAYFWLLPAILIFWWLARRDPNRWSIKKIASILFVTGMSLAAVRGWWRGGIEQFGKESVLAGCWLLGVAWTVWAATRRTEDGSLGTKGGGQWSVVGGRNLVLWALVLTPFLCGIGTNTSIADYAGQGTVFFVTVGILLLGRLHPSVVFPIATCALVGLCLIQASRVSSALLGMYRLGSVLEQTEDLEFGPEAGRLRVDRNTQRETKAIHQLLQANGFQKSTPVVGVDSLCGWIYLSGGSSPGVPWFFRDQPEYLKQVLAKVEPSTLRRTWVWTRSSSNIRQITSWWPETNAPVPTRLAGEIPLITDRGEEKLSIFQPDL